MYRESQLECKLFNQLILSKFNSMTLTAHNQLHRLKASTPENALDIYQSQEYLVNNILTYFRQLTNDFVEFNQAKSQLSLNRQMHLDDQNYKLTQKIMNLELSHLEHQEENRILIKKCYQTIQNYKRSSKQTSQQLTLKVKEIQELKKDNYSLKVENNSLKKEVKDLRQKMNQNSSYQQQQSSLIKPFFKDDFSLSISPIQSQISNQASIQISLEQLLYQLSSQNY